MIVKLLTEHHLEFLSFKGGCTGSSESTLDKMPHCWKSPALAQFNCVDIIPEITYIILVYSPYLTMRRSIKQSALVVCIHVQHR